MKEKSKNNIIIIMSHKYKMKNFNFLLRTFLQIKINKSRISFVVTKSQRCK